MPRDGGILTDWSIAPERYDWTDVAARATQFIRSSLKSEIVINKIRNQEKVATRGTSGRSSIGLLQ